MRIDIVTIFPDYFGPLDVSLLGKARERGLLDIGVHDLREHTDDVHRSVDDAPYGGGPGMLMRPEPWGRALDAVAGGPAGRRPARRCWSSRHRPAGASVQADAQAWADEPWLIVACGRYEGHRRPGGRGRGAPGCGSRRSRSATTSSPVARSPRS